MAANYFISQQVFADMAHIALTHPQMSQLKWPLSRASLYRVAYQGAHPSPAKMLKFIEAFAQTGMDPRYPTSPPGDGPFPLWDKVEENLSAFFVDSRPRLQADPIMVEVLDRWIPLLMAREDLQERLSYPIHYVYPSYEELHEMGAWHTSVSPYDLVRSCAPKNVIGLYRMLESKFQKRLVNGDSYVNLLGVMPGTLSASTLYALRAQRITGNYTPGSELAKCAATVAAMALGASSNAQWEYTMKNARTALPEPLQQFGKFNITALHDEFLRRLLAPPLPCTVQATFTPFLQQSYDRMLEANKNAREAAKLHPSMRPVDEVSLNDLFCMAIASQVNLKWTAKQIMALAVYFHVPLHSLFLWIMEATVIYRRRFMTDNTARWLRQAICEKSGIDIGVYDAEFFNGYQQFVATLGSSREDRFTAMKHIADTLTGIDPEAASRKEVPIEHLTTFYEMVVGCVNPNASTPLTEAEIRAAEEARPSDLYGPDDDGDDDPAPNLLDVLAEDDDDEEEFFIPEGGPVKFPTMPKKEDQDL